MSQILEITADEWVCCLIYKKDLYPSTPSTARLSVREHTLSRIVSGADTPRDPTMRLGPYEIVALIGAGGMGEVYRGRDTRLDRDIAIKVLNERLALDGRLLARFRTEAKAIAALSHPNIVSIYDAELQLRPLFLVTELLEGQTIRKAIERSPLSWERTVEIGAAVADGLGAAHAASISSSGPQARKHFPDRSPRRKDS